MNAPKALVTLVVGRAYRANFRRYCEAGWRRYARRHGLDLVVLTEVLDGGARARGRSVAWQKCLVLGHAAVRRYTQVAWVDADILINPASPNIFDGVPLEKIGAVDEYGSPSRAEHRAWLERRYAQWAREGIPFVDNLAATDYYRQFGLAGAFESVVQTGVLVLAPEHHRGLLEHVYQRYEDRGGAAWNYEMRPLGYEILTHNLAHWLDPKFNTLWSYVKDVHYPFLSGPRSPLRRRLGRALRKIGIAPRPWLAARCATTAYHNSYFLHFAGCPDELGWVKADRVE